MAKFDVYRLETGELLLDCQADLLSSFNTRVVVPLLKEGEAPPPASRLNPIFDVNGKRCVMATQFIASVPVRELGTPIAKLADQDSAVSNALDMLFIGF
jgi:toxin CcdB